MTQSFHISFKLMLGLWAINGLNEMECENFIQDNEFEEKLMQFK